MNAYTIVKTIKKGYKIVGIDNTLNYSTSGQYIQKMKTFKELEDIETKKITDTTFQCAKLMNVYRSDTKNLPTTVLQIADLIGYDDTNITTTVQEFIPDHSLTMLNTNKIMFDTRDMECMAYINIFDDKYTYKINGVKIDPNLMNVPFSVSFSAKGKFIHTKEKWELPNTNTTSINDKKIITRNYAFVFEDIQMFDNLKKQIYNIFMKYYHKNKVAQEKLTGLYHGEIYDPQIMSDKLCNGMIMHTYLLKRIMKMFKKSKKNNKKFVNIPCDVSFNVYFNKNIKNNDKYFATLGGVTFVVDEIDGLV